ncbi:MAG: SBBP repeat-containing protein [Chitinophagales bacterium]|nr:SBBP repeat-containing protein [Chitinophagales bacterium]MDW8394018.1 SBBP repeat-containing protein [Chitinophagales bacterium]
MNIKKSWMLILCGAAFFTAATAQPVQQLDYSPQGFIQQVGQFIDQYGQPNTSVLYVFQKQGFRLHLRKDGFSYEWVRVDRQPRPSPIVGPGLDFADDEWFESIITSDRVDVHFEGSNRNPVVVSSQPAETRIHYYTPPAQPVQPLHAPVVQQITYVNLYEGIDLVVRYDEHHAVSPLRYYFRIKKGADARQIRMRYDGLHQMHLSADGMLSVEGSLGWVRETPPLAFYASSGETVPVRRTLQGHRSGFRLADYADEIIIDPNLLWGTLYGGPQAESIGEVATDKQDKLLIAGSTSSSSNIATSGAHQTVYKGNDDMFLAKLKSNGKMEWATYLGGTNDEIGYGVTTDKNNNVILLGKSQSGNQITTPGAYQTEGGGLGDNCIAKFNKDGILTWCTLLGELSSEHFRTAVCDDKANIYACGYTGADSLKISNKNPSYYEGNGDAFVVKFSPNGFPSWSAYVGGNGMDRAHGIALDQFGNIYVIGTTESPSGLATPGAHQTTYGGTEDAFIAKLDSTGNELWVTYYGGTGDDHGRGILCNRKAHIYVGGYGNSAGVFGTPGSYQKNINSKKQPNGAYTYDGFIAKFNYNGQRIWGSYYGGGRDDQITGVDWDGDRSIYVSGVTASTDSISTASAFQKHRYGTNNDGCFALFDSLKGALTYGSFLGGIGDDRMEDITAGPNKLIYMVGTATAGIYSRPDVWQPSPSGNVDNWLIRFHIGANCLDELEPNETLNAAYSLAVTTDTTIYGYTASIKTGTDQDWFKVKTTAPNTNLKIRLTDMTKNYTLALYNSSGSLLATSYADPAGGQTLVYNHNKKKTYYLLVQHDANTFDSVICYRLRAWVRSTPYLGQPVRNTLTFHTEKGRIELDVFPNPASRVVTVSCSLHEATEVTLRLLSASGALLLSRTVHLQPGTQTVQLDLPDLPTGTYLLDCSNAAWRHQEKLVIH